MSTLADAVRTAARKPSLDAKRTGSERQGTQGWFPYYAGYASGFVEKILGAVTDETAQLRVLDPWNGSGTTTSVAHDLGHVAYGFDINPFLAIVASAKLAHAEDALHVSGLARRLAVAPPRVQHPRDPLLAWLAPSTVARYRGIEHALIAELATTPQGSSLDPAIDGLPPLAAFLLLALTRTARTFASMRHGSNPTWVRPGDTRRTSGRRFGERWLEHVTSMADDLKSAVGDGPRRAWNGKLGVADARCLPLGDSSVDIVLTSPPYCTRIDYIVSASFELAAFGIDAECSEFVRLRKTSMGTPLSREQALPAVCPTWPTALKQVLSAIREHPSKASHSYYYRTYWQYFDDVMRALRELRRVVRPGGAAVLVVQSSYYKEVEIDLPQLYVTCAETLGFDAEVSSALDVRRAMSQINPHARRHLADKRYREGIVVLERRA